MPSPSGNSISVLISTNGGCHIYYQSPYDYEAYEPAYRMGWEAYDPYVTFENREVELRRRWEADHGESPLTWDKAREAMKDASDRIAGPGTQPNRGGHKLA